MLEPPAEARIKKNEKSKVSIYAPRARNGIIPFEYFEEFLISENI